MKDKDLGRFIILLLFFYNRTLFFYIWCFQIALIFTTPTGIFHCYIFDHVSWFKPLLIWQVQILQLLNLFHLKMLHECVQNLTLHMGLQSFLFNGPHNTVIILKILQFKNSSVIGLVQQRLQKNHKTTKSLFFKINANDKMELGSCLAQQVEVRPKCASYRAPKYVSKYEIHINCGTWRG